MNESLRSKLDDEVTRNLEFLAISWSSNLAWLLATTGNLEISYHSLHTLWSVPLIYWTFVLATWILVLSGIVCLSILLVFSCSLTCSPRAVMLPPFLTLYTQCYHYKQSAIVGWISLLDDFCSSFTDFTDFPRWHFMLHAIMTFLNNNVKKHLLQWPTNKNLIFVI